MDSFAALTRSHRVVCRTFFIGAAVLQTSALAFAAEPAAVAAQPTGTGDLWFALFRMIGALALVLALFAGGLWLARRFPVLRAGRSAPKLTILEARSLGQRQALYVIAYEQERLLIATSPAGVTLLTQLPPAPAIEPAAPTPPAEFATTLQNLLRGGRA